MIILLPCVSRAKPLHVLPLANGLKDNWKNKPKFDNDHTQDGPVLGGLTDEHASSVRPKFDKHRKGLGIRTDTEVSFY